MEMTNSTLYSAMAKAFAAIESAVKDRENPHFKSKYADLTSVINAIKPPLIANGLWFMQMTHEHDKGVCIETIICHESGEQLSFGKLFVPASKTDAQGYGSALSYARSYSLVTAFGVPTEDDDGNAATAKAVIPDAEWFELVQLIDVTRSDTQIFCELYGIKSIRELPSDKFDDAKGKLNKKLKAMVKQEMENGTAN